MHAEHAFYYQESPSVSCGLSFHSRSRETSKYERQKGQFFCALECSGDMRKMYWKPLWRGAVEIIHSFIPPIPLILIENLSGGHHVHEAHERDGRQQNNANKKDGEMQTVPGRLMEAEPTWLQWSRKEVILEWGNPRVGAGDTISYRLTSVLLPRGGDGQGASVLFLLGLEPSL